MLKGRRVWTRVLSLRHAGALGLLVRASSCEGAVPSAGHLARTHFEAGAAFPQSQSLAAAAAAAHLFFR